MNYPPEHQKIVNELLRGGKFLLYGSPLFSIIYDNHVLYKEFFLASFGYELIITNDYAYLASKESKNPLSRNFLIFLCALCYEFNQEGKQISSSIEKSIFDYDQIDSYLKKSIFNDAINEFINNNVGLDEFLKKLKDKNIIEFIDSNNHKFKFTGAVKIFLDCAIKISYSKMSQESSNEKNTNVDGVNVGY
jgi:hypothetical protein